MIATALVVADRFPRALDYVPAQIVSVLLVGLAAVPLRPLQAFALAFAIHALYALSLVSAQAWELLASAEWDAASHVFLFMITLLSTGLTGVIYHERSSRFRSHQDAVRFWRELRYAQSRALLADNAASLGKLATALCHELNSPLGALSSAVDTLLQLVARQLDSAAPGNQRLANVQSSLSHSVNVSRGRLRDIVSRMQRLTYLNQADVQSVDIAELLTEVVGLFESQLTEPMTVEKDFGRLPALVCRPQHLSAVFSSLVDSAIKATQGSGKIRISASQVDSSIEVRIQDDGPGMTPEELASALDVGFRVSEGRMSTGDWSLFGVREVVHDHRGEIRLEGAAGGGTVAVVTLPL